MERNELNPDRRVQHAIAMVFARVAELGSVRQVLMWLREENRSLPTPDRFVASGGQVLGVLQL
jgi:hypothetical protein